ncbi:MAG: hypothetical protein WBW92_09760, partial [Rhodanobacteraceae bacterium]
MPDAARRCGLPRGEADWPCFESLPDFTGLLTGTVLRTDELFDTPEPGWGVERRTGCGRLRGTPIAGARWGAITGGCARGKAREGDVVRDRWMLPGWRVEGW